jgi:hypothetical protein
VAFPRETAVGNLHQQPCAVAHQRIGSNGAAMRQVFEHEQPVTHDLMRLLALHVRNKTNAAGIVLVARIIKTLFGRQSKGMPKRVGRLGFGASLTSVCCDLRW